MKSAYNVRNATLARGEECFCACKENNGLGSAHSAKNGIPKTVEECMSVLKK